MKPGFTLQCHFTLSLPLKQIKPLHRHCNNKCPRNRVYQEISGFVLMFPLKIVPDGPIANSLLAVTFYNLTGKQNLRQSDEYRKGAREFVNSARANSGMDPTYNTWVLHGENSTYSGMSMQCGDIEMTETYQMYRDQVYFQEPNVSEHTHESSKVEFTNLIKDAETPLYPGCTKHTKISATVSLFKHKVTHGISDKGFDELLQIVRDILPSENTLPESLYSTKKLLKTFDLGYEKIHACINDCCLFRKELGNAHMCPKCGASRWKVNERTEKIQQGVPANVLRYFPIIPRLKRMFSVTDMAEQLRWHQTYKSQDGKMRHPVDSLAWDIINKKWPSFASDSRNIRFGLATDGFNPFQDLSTRYSCWPVILVIYNLPPWLCMSKDSLMLSLLIPGPKQPGNDIDVYLAPLVEDLKELWINGVEVYDALSESTFNLRTILMWTINDFPAYANLSGWSTKGKLACPNLLVRHNLDVMHIEKNICDSIVSTLLNIKGKTKDGLNSRLDLKRLDIRKDLHPKKDNNVLKLPAASHTLSKKEKLIFCKRLASLKLPDGYGSNIEKCISVDECKVVGLKSHDCHMLMQQLIPVALRGILPKGPRKAIFRLCAFFNKLCNPILDRSRLQQLEEEVTETLCMLERFFPPSFFDIMIHLTIHLGREARLCGPVQYRWMYPIERFMKILKGYVENRARPDGCIAERFIAEEYASFCSKYIKQAAEIGTQHGRNEEFENDLLLRGRPISRGKSVSLSDEMLHIAHRYILFNSSEITMQQRQTNLPKTLTWLARGPRNQAMSFSGYVINGLRFHTKEAEKSRQDSGVSLEANTICRASARDPTQVVGKVPYYGVLRDILVLDYNTFQVPIFKCDWANIVNGVKVEEGFTLVNLHEGQSQFGNDPFILASQAKQVFYSEDIEKSNWGVKEMDNAEAVGVNSDKYASFIGVITREHVPVCMKNWLSVDHKLKEDLWSLVQEKFVVDESRKRLALRMMGDCWRRYKSELTTKIKQANKEHNKARVLALIKPKNITSKEDWAKFVKERLSPEFKKKKSSNPFEITRVDVWIEGHLKKNGQPVNEAASKALEKVRECHHSKDNARSNNICNDAIAKVFGPEKRGQVRGLGFGATPTQLEAHIRSTGKVKELQNQLQAQSERMSVLEKNYEHLTAALLKQCQQNPSKDDVDEIVAEGTIASTDPKAKVHHMPLGRDCWKVWVESISDGMDEVTLYKVTDEAHIIVEALGSTIAWPKSCIKLF
ncbi:hypothetical protein KPL71_026529 [Citrus sinensis]|uniref:Uncharacterized protein n=1 Tax=Citrus sinensis TaxID=2711 RepID=A0ACB8I000_CITSI|nr:hypothetical protein KPL71_026529 [Citrus sinensis]